MKYLSLFVFGILLWSSVTFAYFEDVDVTHPHYYAIEYLQRNSVVQGYKRDDGFVFKSFQPVLRSEALKMLLVASDIPEEAGENPFSDIQEGQWYTPYVLTAYKKKIVSGFPDGTFHPEYTVTRAEFLKMTLLAFQAPVEEKQDAQEWFEPYIQTAYNLRIIDSESEDPAHKMTRGEIAEVLYRTAKVAEKNFRQKYVFSGFGESSYYGFEFAGKSTANGEIYDPEQLTAAHRTLPFGTYIRVKHNDKYVVVRVNDRGPYHQKRVLDLSQRAFEYLAPLSTGVLDIEFEVVSGPEEEQPEIPSSIQSKLNPEGQNKTIPDVIADVMDSPDEKTGRHVLFASTITHLPEDFFPNAEMRHTIPQVVPQGTIKNFRGRANEYGHESVHIFLQKIGSPNQLHFEGEMSGKNFTVPVSFLEAGRYNIGLVFDDQKKSRVEVIEVRPWNKKRWFPASSETFETDIQYRVIPEEQKVIFSWNAKENALSKIDTQQGQYTKTLYVEDSLNEIELPYDYFGEFNEKQQLTIMLSQAISQNGTLEYQETNWKEVQTVEFTVIPGFPDQETDDIAIFNFQRYVHDQRQRILNGRIKNPNITIHDMAYVQAPSGFVKDVPVSKKGETDFSIPIIPEGEGAYIIQIVADDKSTLFKRAVYMDRQNVLPVKEWRQTPVRGDSVIAMRDWINRLRYAYDIPSVTEEHDLSIMAQEYADLMAENNFISHTSIDGKTFQDRLEDRGEIFEGLFTGYFGENLGQADTLENALWGLENSMAHRKNILTRKWRKVGLGLTRTEKGVYVVQIFAQ